MYQSKLTTDVSRESTLKSLQMAARLLCARWWPDLFVDAVTSGDGGWIAIGSFPWELVEAKHLDGLRDDMIHRKGKSGDPAAWTSVNKVVSTVRKLLRIAFREKLIDADTVQRVREVEGARKNRLDLAGRALHFSETDDLLDACDTTTNRGIRDHAIISVLYGCGLRRAEIGALRIRNYDGKKVSVLGKGGKMRTVPVEPDVAEAVDDWLVLRRSIEMDKDPYLFTSLSPGTGGKLKNTRLSSQAVFKIVDKLVMDAGLKESCSPHDLRRTFASEFLDSGGDIATLQRLLGHVSVATTALYDRRHERANVEGIERLTAYRKKIREEKKR